MLGTDRHQARSRLPAHSRIHLFIRRGLSEGWDLCLSDHAEIGYGLLSGLPQRPVAKVCQISSWFSTAPPTIAAATSCFPAISRCSSCHPTPRDQPEGKSLG